ncbi:MAG: PHP domain-containing protein, partial [Bacteroidota bacterium]
GEMNDLHIHTCCTDGRMSPEETVTFMVKKGFTRIVVTDHDTLAPQETVKALCEKQGIEWMSGVEINTRYKDPAILGEAKTNPIYKNIPK